MGTELFKFNDFYIYILDQMFAFVSLPCAMQHLWFLVSKVWAASLVQNCEEAKVKECFGISSSFIWYL